MLGLFAGLDLQKTLIFLRFFDVFHVGRTSLQLPYAGAFGPHLGPSWGHLGANLGTLGAILGHLGVIWGALGAILGPLK